MGDLASQDILYDAMCLHPVMVKHLGTYIWVALLTAEAVYLGRFTCIAFRSMLD